MKFELKPYNLNATDKELLYDLIKIAKELKTEKLKMRDYDRKGRFSGGTIARRFGSWNNALGKAGLEITRKSNLTDEELLEDMKRVAKEIAPQRLTQSSYSNKGKFTTQTIGERLGWNNALIKIGLEVTVQQNITEEELYKNLEETWIKLGRQPGRRDMIKPFSKYSERPYINKFRTWRKALESFVEFINAEKHIQENEDNEILKEVKEIETKNQPYIHKTKRDINLRLRFLVMRRDNFKCVNDGRSPATHIGITLHVDHIIPWSKNGETVLENLQTLCSDCNLGKSNMDMYEN
ncbi:MAG: HNH endonuclease [Deltaproteobacteria bacterium]|nr:HNH endonuclease [Deltaproteobacteria bacterium]